MNDKPHDSDVIELLSALVACPSINPLIKGVGGNHGEMALAELVVERISDWGGQVEIVETKPQRPNVIARFAGKDRSRTLALEAHLDTVEIEGMTLPPFEPNIRDGKLYGRGSCDTKASMAAMLTAIRTVLDEDGAPPTDVCFVGACGEELEALGAMHLVDSGFVPDAIVVGEPTDLAVVTCSKGTHRFTIETVGRACHSSDPTQGVSAISKMMAVVADLNGSYAEAIAKRAHPLLGAPTVSVGTIHGGEQFNMVPDRCWIGVDRRVAPGETVADVDAEVIVRLDAMAAADANFRYRFESHVGYPPFEQDGDSPLVRRALAACERVLGQGRTGGVAYASDAGIYGRAGWPCILLGPGDIAQAHTADEFVEIAQVAAAVDIYAEIIRRFGGRDVRLSD